MLVKPGERIAILMHNTIIKDLESENMFVNLTVLTMLRYFINDDISTDIIPLLRKLLKHKVAMIRRKALLVLYNIYQAYPHLVTDIRDMAFTALAENETPVHFAAIGVIKMLINSADDLSPFKPHTSKIVDAL